MFGIETKFFSKNYDDPPTQLFETSELSNQLYALTIGHQIGKSPFILKIALGTNNYNFEIEDNFGQLFYWDFHLHFMEVRIAIIYWKG